MSEALQMYERAFADLKRFAQGLSGVLALAEHLKTVGSIEQAVEEAEKALAAKRAEAGTIVDQAKQDAEVVKAAAQDAIAKAQNDAAAKAVEAQKTHQGILKDAAEAQRQRDMIVASRDEERRKIDAAAAATMAAARAGADGIVSEARAKAEAESAAAKKASDDGLAKARSEAAVIKAANEAGQTALAALHAEVVAAEARLAEINTAIDHVKKKFG